MDSGSNPLIAAATLIVIREGAAAPELLMLERSAAMRFAAGALVFPGGRVDPDDFALAEALTVGRDLDREDLAARIAAIRETIEETGIAIGLSPPPDIDTLAGLRIGLAGGGKFSDLIAAAGLTIDIHALMPFARWVPPEDVRHRRFDTRFFVASAPVEASEVADGTESVHAFWATASAVLADADSGRHKIIFPTRANLVRLAQFGSFAEIRVDAESHGDRLTQSRAHYREGVRWVSIDEDLGYSYHSHFEGESPRD